MKKILIILLIFFLSLGLTHEYFIPIKQIQCTTQFGPCPDELLQNLSNFENQRKPQISKNLNSLSGSDGTIIDVHTKYKFPAKLLVYVQLNKPDIAVKINDTEQFVLLSQDGQKMDIVSQTQLPILTVTTYTPDWKEIAQAAEILSNIYYWNGINRASMDSQKMIIGQGETLFYFPLKGDLDYELGTYKLLLSWLNSESGKIKMDNRNGKTLVFDLRYNNPVIRYE